MPNFSEIGEVRCPRTFKKARKLWSITLNKLVLYGLYLNHFGIPYVKNDFDGHDLNIKSQTLDCYHSLIE